MFVWDCVLSPHRELWWCVKQSCLTFRVGFIGHASHPLMLKPPASRPRFLSSDSKKPSNTIFASVFAPDFFSTSQFKGLSNSEMQNIFQFNQNESFHSHVEYSNWYQKSWTGHLPSVQQHQIVLLCKPCEIELFTIMYGKTDAVRLLDTLEYL